MPEEEGGEGERGREGDDGRSLEASEKEAAQPSSHSSCIFSRFLFAVNRDRKEEKERLSIMQQWEVLGIRISSISSETLSLASSYLI